VLCDLHRRITGAGEWEDNDNYRVGHETAIEFLPEAVCQWAGLDSNPSLLNPDDTYNHHYTHLAAAVINDSGKNFAQIADLIEQTPEL